MKSKRYCPSCGSFQIHRVRRSLLQKHLLKQSPKYKCVHCFAITSRNQLEKNELAFQPGLFNASYDNQEKSVTACEEKLKERA